MEESEQRSQRIKNKGVGLTNKYKSCYSLLIQYGVFLFCFCDLHFNFHSLSLCFLYVFIALDFYFILRILNEWHIFCLSFVNDYTKQEDRCKKKKREKMNSIIIWIMKYHIYEDSSHSLVSFLLFLQLKSKAQPTQPKNAKSNTLSDEKMAKRSLPLLSATYFTFFFWSLVLFC